MKTWTLAILSVIALLPASAPAQEKAPPPDPPQLSRLRSDYLRMRQRDSGAAVAKYQRTLTALKQQLGREAKLEAALAVEQEMKRVADESQRNAGGGATPRPRRAIVQCYMEENFKGREYRIEGPAEFATAAAAGIPNDKLASMKIPKGLKVTLFGNPGFKGNSETFTGDVPNVGGLKGVTTSLIIAAADPDAPPALTANEPPELTTRRQEYQAEVKQATAPALAAYRRNLTALKDQLTRESKFEAALAVEREMQSLDGASSPP